MKIAISGTAGSGKSTIAKMLAKKLACRHYSMGDFQREIADEMGLTIYELGELEKKDPSIDRKTDARQKKLDKEEGFVIDSWLSAHFIPSAYKIFMTADLDERARRIFKRKKSEESYKTANDAKNYIQQRERTNRERWLRYYGFDFMDLSNYDYVLDSTGKSINKVFETLLEHLYENKIVKT